MTKTQTPIWNDAWAKRPDTMEELWKEIGFLSFSLGTQTKFVWRGLANETFNIESSLSRRLRRAGIAPTESAVRLNEEQLLGKARRWGLGHSEYGHASDLHLLAMMQHHGVPTRLVDVSYNPLTALWFACSDPAQAGVAGVLACLAVSSVPIIETVPVSPELTLGNIGDPLRYPLRHALEESASREMPFLVEPVVRDSRMAAQEGLFIAAAVPSASMGTPMEGFPYKGSWVLLRTVQEMRDMGSILVGDEWPTFGILGLVISPELKALALPVLENTFNRTHRTMYPDLAGFATQDLDFLDPLRSKDVRAAPVGGAAN